MVPFSVLKYVLVTFSWWDKISSAHNLEEEMFILAQFQRFCPRLAGSDAEIAWWKGFLWKKASYVIVARKQREKGEDGKVDVPQWLASYRVQSSNTKPAIAPFEPTTFQKYCL